MEYSDYEALRYLTSEEPEKTLHMRFQSVECEPYVREVILENECEFLLNMRCICGERHMDVFYSTSGLVRIDEYVSAHVMNIVELIKLMREVVRAVKHCGEYLIAPEELILSRDMIFVEAAGPHVKLVYLPEYRSQESLRERIADLSEKLCRECVCASVMSHEVESFGRKMRTMRSDALDEILSFIENEIRAGSLFQKKEEIFFTDTFHEKDRSLRARETGKEYSIRTRIRKSLSDFFGDIVT